MLFFQTEESSTIDDTTPHTSREITQTNDSTPQTSRPRLIQSEVKEAGKYLKEALSTFQDNMKKRESTAPPDDCEVYGIMLAKKLRAFTEMERLEIMYDIDGLIINRRRSKQQHQFSSDTFAPSPTAMCRPSSSISSYSEPLPSEWVHRNTRNTRQSYSEPPVIHISGLNTQQLYSEPTVINIAEEQNPQQLYSEPPVIHITEGQNTQTDEPNVVILRNELLSDAISKAYDGA